MSKANIKYIEVQKYYIFAPSKSTIKAMHQLDSGEYYEQTLIERLEQVQASARCPELAFAISTLKRCFPKEMVSSWRNNISKVYISHLFVIMEKMVMDKLTQEEKAAYSFNMHKLVYGEPLKKIYKQHSLRNKSNSLYGMFTRDLHEYWSFLVRRDEQVKEKLARGSKTNTIICLYKYSNTPDKLPMLAAIGSHDTVYKIDPKSYNFVKPELDSEGQLIPSSQVLTLFKDN